MSSSLRILVIEDDKRMLELLRKGSVGAWSPWW